MARHRSSSYHAGPRALMIALPCIVVAASVLHFDVADGLTVPAWTVVVAFLSYVGLAAVTLGRASLRWRAAWLAGACATHVVFVVTTAALVAAGGSVSWVLALPAAIESPVATVVFTVGVPFALLPFRGRLLPRPAGRVRGHRRAARPALAGDPRTSASAAGDMPLSPDGSRGTGATLSTAAAPAAADGTGTATAALPSPPPAVTGLLAGPLAAPLPIRAGAEETLRIPFKRVAAQLPAEAFLLPMERLAETMRSPHELLVPRSLVVEQLGEGRVEVAWTLVEDQFPILGFALEASEVRRRYPDLRLALPLDVVVPQLPSALFSNGAPAAEVAGLDRYPAPFRPSSEQPALAAPLPSPSSVLTRPVPATEVATPLAPPAQAAPVTIAAPPSPKPAAVTAPVDVSPTLVDPVVAPATPVDSKPAVHVRTSVVVPAAPRETDPVPDALLAHGHRLAARLAAFGPLEVVARRVTGTTVLSLVTGGLPQEAIERAAARSAPLLSGAQHVTIHAERVSMVLTAVQDGVRVVALRAGSPLALLEILIGRACAEDGVGIAPAAAPSGLAAAEVNHRVAELRGALDGFGAVVPAAFVDRASGLDVYVFSAGEERSQRAGEAARVVWQALVRESERDLGRAISVVLREGRRRTVVHPVTAARPMMLAAAGVLTRPGLAYRQAAQAAERLAGA
jgi:hypothetical protein